MNQIKLSQKSFTGLQLKKVGMHLFFGTVITLLFTGLYWYNRDQFKGVNKKCTVIDILYFAFNITSSIRYTDITPITDFAKILIMSHKLLILLDVISLLM